MDGVQVAVASFGRRDVIYKAIASAVGTELADTVYITTPGDFDGYVVAGLRGCGVACVCVRSRWRSRLSVFFFRSVGEHDIYYHISLFRVPFNMLTYIYFRYH